MLWFSDKRVTLGAVALCVAAAGSPGAAAGQGIGTTGNSESASLSPGGGLLLPDPATVAGDLLTAFHQERKRLEDRGVMFKLQEQSEVWGNLAGGRRRGLAYDGLITGDVDVDLAKLVGWTGAEFYASAFDIQGHGPTPPLVGSLQLVSSIEARPSLKLFDLWLDQTLFDGRLSLRVGQEGADDEMMTTAYAALYIDSTFGFPDLMAVDLPSGGPAYPLAVPFFRAQVKATNKLTLVGAVYTDDPAPLGPGDPQIRDRNGTAFRFDDHTLAFSELRYAPHSAGNNKLPTTYKLGVWYASGPFADPANSRLAPREHEGDYAVYGAIDQAIWRRPGTQGQGIGAFLRVMAGPADRNLSNLMVEGGLNWRAPLAARPDDSAGLALCYLGISPAAQSFSRGLVALGRAAAPYAGNETIVEATYQAPLTGWLTLQPDLQLVLNPNAGTPDDAGRVPRSPDLIIGLRVSMRL